MKLSALFLVLTITLTTSGCTSLSYYTQSVVGHSRLMLARTSIDQAIINATEQNDSELVSLLTLTKQLRQFSVTELGLPDNKSYKSYVSLSREYPVWVGVAAEEFSLDAKQWCYPVIGCASYRGYFKQESAERYFSNLVDKGYEISVGGVAAYSTLGWFADPVLPSMLRYGEVDFAETLFHELAHQQLYVNGDSSFNEAFATVVGESGVELWLSQYAPEKVADYKARVATRNDFNSLLTTFKRRLAMLYKSDQSVVAKRQAKQALYDELPMLYENMKQEQWNNKPWFDNWFNRPLNNARLASLATYRSRVPALRALLEKCDGDFLRFYRSLEKLEKIDGVVQLPKQCFDV